MARNLGRGRCQLVDTMKGTESSMQRTLEYKGEAMEDYCNNTESKQLNCQLPSPDSILEFSTVTESCYSSESLARCSTEGRNHFSENNSYRQCLNQGLSYLFRVVIHILCFSNLPSVGTAQVTQSVMPCEIVIFSCNSVGIIAFAVFI